MKKAWRAFSQGTASAEDMLRVMLGEPGLSQACETLLSSLALREQPGLPRSLMVCSTQPEEGKTTVATLLALTAGLAGKGVLLVDADLRQPRVHQLFNLGNEIGLSDYLAGRASLADAISHATLVSESPARHCELDVMPSGLAHSDEFNRVPRGRFVEVITEMTSKHEFVIFDCPPVLAVSDALFLASAVEGVLMVVDSGAVSRHHAKLANSRIEKAGGRLLGFVMNRVDENRAGIPYHPYHGHYARQR